ncbi:MAG: zinc ABC transporter substrate-binding protein, partial [Clostridia bacterium]|nr:zinc ABC transporter substrate-binding protein [Clostridia bacterium]
EDEVDEHVWLSLRNARKLVKALAVALGEADPANAGRYTANADAYAEKLAALDAEYTAAREAAEFDTVLFGDRFPFRYLVDDYNLNYYAAFSGCSAESEASFETIVFLAGKVDALGLTTVLTIEGDNHRIAETIVGNTQAKDAKVLAMDSLQGTTGEDVKNGATYLGVMEANLEVLKQALVR